MKPIPTKPMHRRGFLKRSMVLSTSAAVVTGLKPLVSQAASSATREYYELRVYRLKPGSKSSLLDSYLEKAAIPAWNRLGIKMVGVFTEKETEKPAVFVLLPLGSPDLMTQTPARLNTDRAYLAAAEQYLSTTKENPAFERIDSWLLLAFTGMPKMELAAHCRERTPSRIFELRTYESYSEAKAAKKIAMFNDGETQIMRDVGLAPVFFGQALAGANLPHLTYMTSGENEQEHKKHWDAFVKHPAWDKMKNDPQYADTVSKITKWMLVPTPYSQI